MSERRTQGKGWRRLMIRLGLRPDPNTILAALPALPESADRETITVSLTSIGSRVADVHCTIESILEGTLRPDRLILYLSESPHLADQGVDPARLPESFRRLEQRGLEIAWVDNIGPYRKIVPAWPEVKSSGGVLVTADDDIMYDEHWLEMIYRYHLAYPDAIICYRGFTMTGFEDGRLERYMKWPRHRMEPPARNVFPTGKDGVLYPASSLSDEVCHREKFLALAPTSDDVWLKAMSLLAGAEVKNITHHRDFRIIKGSNAKTLFERNRSDNDRMIRAVFDEYGLK